MELSNAVERYATRNSASALLPSKDMLQSIISSQSVIDQPNISQDLTVLNVDYPAFLIIEQFIPQIRKIF